MTVCGHDADFIGQLLTTGWYFWLIYMAFVCIGTMMLLNMLIGVLCEVVTTVSTEETEEAFRADVEKKVTEIVMCLDSDGSMTVSEVEFKAMVDDPVKMKSIKSFDIDVIAFVSYIHFILMDPDQPNEIALEDFIEIVIQLRGTNASTVKDLIEMRKFVTLELDGLEEQVFKAAAPPEILKRKRFMSQGPKLEKSPSAQASQREASSQMDSFGPPPV